MSRGKKSKTSAKRKLSEMILELLVERKLKLFPDDKRLVVDARVVPKGTSYRVEVVSAALP